MSSTTAELKAIGKPPLALGSRAKAWCLRKFLPARQPVQQDQDAEELVANMQLLLIPVLGQVSGLSNEHVQTVQSPNSKASNPLLGDLPSNGAQTSFAVRRFPRTSCQTAHWLC